MTLQEIRERIAESEDFEWFNSIELNLNFSHINFTTTIVGTTSIYEFFTRQLAGWEKKGENLPSELKSSKDIFENSRARLIELLSSEYSWNKTRIWNEITSELQNSRRYYFIYEAPEVDFLLKIYTEFPKSYPAAYNFITGNINNSFSDKDYLIGTLLSYEFSLKDHSSIVERRSSEKASLSRIRNEFQKYLQNSEKEIAEYFNKTNERFSEYSSLIDDTKSSKENLFGEWFENVKQNFQSFREESNKKVSDLERAYEELLSLKKPTEYWNKRAKKLKTEGHLFLKWLVGLVLFGCTTLYFLLWLTPEGMLLSFIKGNASAIKWSIVYVTFISFLAFGIKALSKVIFSSFHLARDAEEREQLTYVYLAMIKEGSLEEKDKTLIMQSLFSRSDTGLLKEDSSPTMPGNVADKIIQGGR